MNQLQPGVFARDKAFVLIRSSLTCVENRRLQELKQQQWPPPNPELSQRYNMVTKETYTAALAPFPHCCLKVKQQHKAKRHNLLCRRPVAARAMKLKAGKLI